MAGVFDSETSVAKLASPVSPRHGRSHGVLSRRPRRARGALRLRPPTARRARRWPCVRRPRKSVAGHMAIDAATRSSLELLVTQRGTEKGSLRDQIDLCVTAAGSRLLARRLAAPLRDRCRHQRRLDAVDALLRRHHPHPAARRPQGDARPHPRPHPARARPRRPARPARPSPSAIAAAPALARGSLRHRRCPAELAGITAILDAAPRRLRRTARRHRRRAAAARPRRRLRRQGLTTRNSTPSARCATKPAPWSPRCRRARAETDVAAEDPAQQRARLLRRGDRRHGDRLLEPPHRQTFIHRQTMANAMRFTTTSWPSSRPHRQAPASGAGLELAHLRGTLRRRVAETAERSRHAPHALAALDVAAASPSSRDPQLLPAGRRHLLAFDIEGGRHPVVEAGGPRPRASPSSKTTAISTRSGGGARLWLSPARTWPASRPSCARTR
jgi:DNA mismatch repair protein MutS